LTFCCSASFDEGDVQLVFRLVMTIKPRVCLSFHALHKHFLCWVKPATTSLLLGTLADRALGKSGTDRGKRTGTRASHHPSSADQATSLPEDGPTSPGCAGSFGHALETIGMVCLMDPVCAAGAGEMPVPSTRCMLLPQGVREGQHAGQRAQALEEPHAVVEWNGQAKAPKGALPM
jgi:hypothetical protein